VAITTLLGGGVARATLADDPTAKGSELEKQFQNAVLPFLNVYCLDCHGNDDPAAKLDLSGYTSAEKVAKEHQTWAIVLDRLRTGEMPPKDSEPQPTLQQRESVIRWINAARDFEAARNAGDPGPVLARRLSNSEYNFSIRDLTGVDIQPTKTFPVDPANEAGFDNSGESLAMSPALLKKYLEAAREVAEHLVLRPDGIAFAPHSVVTDTDRDKYCVKRIVAFYEKQPSDLADYFFAAWRHQQRLNQVDGNTAAGDATLVAVASENRVSAKYLATVWDLLIDEAPERTVGPVATLQTMWRTLSGDAASVDDARKSCAVMRDFVVELRNKLRPSFPNITVEGSHVGSQTFVLWKNRQYVEHRRKLDVAKLQIEGVADEPDEKSDPKKNGEKKDEEKKDDALPFDEDLLVPADEAERARHAAAFERFCSVFPDAFFISERGRDYVKNEQKQMGEKGRLLSAGFHSMMGYFRDDGPLYDMILDEAGQRELDGLWQELDFVTSAPMRQYEGFLWFERTDSRYMRDPQFDFARPEDKAALSEEMIEKLADVYLEKAALNGGGEVELEAIRHYFREINRQIRWVEQARVDAEASHLDAIIEFAGRAFRRRLSTTEREELVAFYRALRIDDGLSHEEAIQDTLVSVLMSPLFCYRVDLLEIGSGRRSLTDDELACRLSYFLWSSTPDAELMKLAAAGTLRQREVLSAQVQRMLQDDRVRGLATEFVGNWLDFRRFEEHNSVDRNRFPEFTDSLRQAMFEEPVRFFMDVAQQDRSVLQFLDGRHTFVNAELARHYGIPVSQQVGIPRTTIATSAEGDVGQADPRIWIRIDDASEYGRGGLLPMSVFLTKNAPGLRTSPVKRGYWVVRRLLGERIPPPPPNVPELPEDESKLGDLTLREALAKHRENVACAGCHERIDSIGLAFEGFGPVGERRDLDLGGRPIDANAVFPGGTAGQGVEDLRKYLMTHRREEFVDNLIRKLVSYALGRSLILPDELLIRDLHEKLKTDNYRFGSLVENIVTSTQFFNKRGSNYLARE
tara:strand:+ start:14506 stop:17589 length:3084 start_codon:yes stop_codon:yes gene_type:complete